MYKVNIIKNKKKTLKWLLEMGFVELWQQKCEHTQSQEPTLQTRTQNKNERPSKNPQVS